MSAPAGPSAGDEPTGAVALQLELEEAQAARLRQEIEHEQAVSDALARVAELERQLEDERTGKGELKSKEAGLEQSLSHLREEYNALQSSLAAESSKTSLLSTQLSSIEAQNRSLQGSVTALDGERSRSQAEVASAKEKAVRWEVRVREVEAEAESRKVESRNFKFKVEALELNLQMANKDNATLTNSITRLTSDFASYRSNAQSQAQAASLELQTVQAALMTSQASLGQLTTSQAQLSNRLTASQTEIATLRTQLVEQKSAFKQEIASQQRLAQSAERRAEDARKRLEEVEREWEEDLARRREGDIRTDEERLVWEDQRAELEAKVAELRDTVDRLVESGITGDADALPDDSEADRGAMLMSPSAALAGSLMRKRGMGISELYVENVRTKTELSKQQEETRRLEDSLQELMRDIQERAPLLKQQRLEYTRLIATANDLAGQLAAVTAERDAETRRAGDEASKVKQLQAAHVDLESHISDLSRQVVSLMREIGVRDEPFLASYQHLADADVDLPDGDDIDSVITRNLIVFRSIPELQAQNQQLIKVVRELGKQLEAAEKAGPTAAAKGDADGESDAEALAMMDEAGEIILGLKAKVEEKEVALAKQTRERDLFARMLSQAGLTLPAGLDLEAAAGSGGGLLDFVKRNLEDFRVELGLDSERLRAELADARKEVNAASVALVRVEAERDFLKDRITALTEANNLQRIQFDGLVNQNQGVKTDLMRVNMELRQAEEKRIEVEGVAERAKLEVANLRAERELWKATEEKLQKDVAEVARDRAGLQSLIEGLRRAEAETLRVQEETRLTAQQTISNLQTERDDLRKELGTVSAKAASAASFEAERDQARVALASSNEAVDRAAAEKAAAEQQLASAKTSFEEEKTRYIGAERKRSEKIFSDNKRFFQQQKDWTVKETELRAQLTSLEARLAETEAKLAEAAAAQEAAAAATPTPEALEASVLASDQYLALQKERDELLKSRDEALSAAAVGSGSEEAVKTLTTELEAAKADLAKAKAAAETEKTAYISSERSRYQNVFNDNKRFRAEVIQFKQEIEALTARATAVEAAAAAAPASTDPDAAAATPPSDEIIQTAVSDAVAKLKVEHEAALAERERKLREELAAAAPAATPMDADGSSSAEAVEAAVKAALAGKEDELKAEYEAALLIREMELKSELEAAVKSAVEATKAAAPAVAASTPAVNVDAAVKAAVTKREVELKAEHATALKAASTAAAPASEPARSQEEVDAAITEAVAAAVAKATSEATSKAGAQKMAIDTQRKKKEKAEAELKALKAEMEALKAGGTPKTSPSAKTATLPKAGTAAAPKRTPSISAAPDAAKAVPTAPAVRAKPAPAAVTPQASTSAAAGSGLPTKPPTSPAAGADSGTSIRGAGRTRGTRGSTRGRGAAASSPATRATVAAAKAGGDSATPPPRSLIGGALNQATASSVGGAGGVKRKGPEQEANAAELNNTLLGRLNKGAIKRPKTDGGEGGGNG